MSRLTEGIDYNALRAATHDFVDPGKRPAIARMANGGPVLEHIEIKSPERLRAERAAAVDASVRKGQRPPSMAKPAGYTPTLDRVSQQMQARAKVPKTSIVGGAARLAAPILATGASINDATQEYSTARYAQRFGVSEPTGDGSVGDMAKFAALRAGGFASDLGNNLTLGAAGNFYRDKPDGLLQFSQGEQPGAASASGATPAAAAASNPALQPPSVPTSAAPGSPRIAQGAGQPGTINVARQPNGVMSFSGSGDVSGGYSGAAAKSLKGGSFNTMPASAFVGGQTPPELVAARAAAAARGDYQGAIDSINEQQGNAPKQKAIAMRLPNTFGEMMQFRAQMALNRFNQKGDAERANAENDRLRITQGAVQSPLDQERARGQKIENDRAQALSALVNQYLTAGDEKTRGEALARLRAAQGSSTLDAEKERGLRIANDQSQLVSALMQEYITAPNATARDAARAKLDAVYAAQGKKTTGQDALLGLPGGELPEGAEGRDRTTGKAYVIKNGQPVLVE